MSLPGIHAGQPVQFIFAPSGEVLAKGATGSDKVGKWGKDGGRFWVAGKDGKKHRAVRRVDALAAWQGKARRC